MTDLHDVARALYESLECDNNHNVRDVTRIIAALREAEVRGLEEAAALRPDRALMKHKLGDWYECGWNDAVVALDETIRIQAAERRAGKGA